MDSSENILDESSPELEPDIIRPINKNAVHRISSGQVVLSLATAVKELVENAIDASATNIEVNLKEFGSELIEVADNGKGVRKDNFEALTLKYYTSKLRQFSDLVLVETLGFRGEALSSLCALSDVTIVTRHCSVPHATKLQFDHNGRILSETPTAKQEGTTVSLCNLFYTLPVRRTHFMKNMKKEFSKMCQLLYAYCLVFEKIKLSCTNRLNNGSKVSVVATQGSGSVRDNILSVFGNKQLPSLIEVEQLGPDGTVLQEYGLKFSPGDPVPFTFHFMISSAAHGDGRSSSDRQFIYINSRPCENAKISKLINKVYKQFNSTQYPFVFLNVMAEKSQVDINVTPDKRQIFLEKEKLILAVLKTSLLSAFKDMPSTFKVQNVGIASSGKERAPDREPRGLKRCTESFRNENENGNTSFLETFKKKCKPDTENKVESVQMTLEETSFKVTDTKVLAELSHVKEEEEHVECKLTTKPEIRTEERLAKYEANSYVLDNFVNRNIENKENKTAEYHLGSASKNVTLSDVSIPEKYMTTSIDAIKKSLRNRQIGNGKKDICVRFRSQIDNRNAEQELQKQISKDMFKKMSVIGQFNKGFIITMYEDDLFIIDQHASDEKYNFEELQRTTILQKQNLVVPKKLELTVANESILMENEEIFMKNGFTFAIDHTAEATKKVLLTSVPISKNVIFGKDDIDEMLFMLQDGSHTTVHPSRVRSMFASRACRKSVMVGDTLSHSHMKQLVRHMGDIEHPWNCPHGRPTMRHLLNLNLLQKT